MSYPKGYQCKKCDYLTTSRGWRNAMGEIEKHFRDKHGIDEIRGKELVEVIEGKPAPKWKCPKCGEEMYYSDRRFHEQNANRAGKPYKCIPKAV